jgi:hypothetical protein
LGRHPWSLTLRQLLDKIERDLGGVRKPLTAIGPRGSTDLSFVARSPEQYATILGIDLDEELTPTTLRSVCIQLGVPPTLFGLEEEEPYYLDVN